MGISELCKRSLIRSVVITGKGSNKPIDPNFFPINDEEGHHGLGVITFHECF
jgi:hypothetical protein